ncbi:AraC family transcriptional regulator ligand-binding domain-containing protein [Zavarzinia sp. CC-PAN008]|uniref:AraC family transcriptional regulator ligand-binding domain-containing protein n=1 Tax=Zavarzinia sp. CC-PAN008 TaxID=3243332 RepID=UPI003F7453A8
MDLTADIAAVRQLLAFLDHLDIDYRALRVTGLDQVAQSRAPRLTVSARLIIESMAAAADLTRRPDLAIQFADWLNPRAFGPLAVLGDYCMTYADRYGLGQTYGHIENNAFSADQVTEGDLVALTMTMRPALRPKAHQFVEGVIALNVRMARVMLGQNWAPARIEFAHDAPPTTQAQRSFFRCPVRYGAERNAYVMPLADFHRPLPQGNPDMLRFLQGHLSRQDGAWPSDLKGQVEILVTAQLTDGVDLPRVARLLAMSPRTLQRRLAQEGTDFGAILAYVRMQIVQEHLLQKGTAGAGGVDRLAHRLGFSEASAACRFIRSQTGQSLRRLATAHFRHGRPMYQRSAFINEENDGNG